MPRCVEMWLDRGAGDTSQNEIVASNIDYDVHVSCTFLYVIIHQK